MTDARLPERWLNDRRVLLASADAWRLYTFALMYTAANRSDGLILPDDLTLIPTVNPDCAAELVKLGLWERCEDGWQVAGFAKTQATREELERLDKARDKDRLRKQRARAAAPVRVDVQADVHRDTARTGQARTGQDRTGRSTEELAPTGEADAQQVRLRAIGTAVGP